MNLATSKQRLLQYLEFKGVARSEFYKETDLKRGLLDSDKLDGSISDVVLAKILATYEDLSVDWLITGSGEMLKSVHPKDILSEPEMTYQSYCRPQQNGMPLIPVDAIGGYANGDVQVQAYEIDKYYVVHEFRERGAKFLIRVSGRSMEPTYNNGDLLACRPVAEVTFMQWGTVYVMDTVQGPIVKRLYECGNQDSDCIKCVSDNGEFPEFRITKKDIRALYMVVGVIRLE